MRDKPLWAAEGGVADAAGRIVRKLGDPQVWIVAGPLVAIFTMALLDLEPGKPEVTRMAGVAVLMALWWVTEAVPLAVTALLPVVCFPLLGLMSAKDVAPVYFNHTILLFIGGFIVALAMERWQLHRRVALRTILLIGCSPGRLLLAFMVATAFLSMWISNTATAMMMLPIAMAVLSELDQRHGPELTRRLGTGLLLAIAYGASIGGMATLIGTPPNLSLARIFVIYFPEAPEISFAQWLLFALPICVVMLAAAWGLLYLLYRPKEPLEVSRQTFVEAHRELGPLSFEEGVVLVDFVLLALLWVFRKEIPLGPFKIHGWSQLLPYGELLDDGTVAIAMAILLFLIPARNEGAERVMDWDGVKRLPWGIVLLFGGGFALASGFKETGLAAWCGEQLQGVGSLPPMVVVASVCALLTFLTELTSNTATTEMILPILASTATKIGFHPLLLMIPATLSASCAFMLPVATPPNAIVFGTGRLKSGEMARAGIVLNLLGILVITCAVFWLGRAVFGITPRELPAWALPT